MEELYNWLLEDSNPAIKYRTQKELMNQDADQHAVVNWISEKLPEKWFETKGLWYRYYITAFAECGLSKEDINPLCFKAIFDEIERKFEWGCADFMILTSLLKLGFSEHETIKRVVSKWSEYSLPDGGFLCSSRFKKFNYTPKSCYKVNLHALIFIAECNKYDVDIGFAKPLIDYFLNRDLFYKTSEVNKLVLDAREGWRTIDSFYPFEPMRVGIQNILEAFTALGYGNDNRLTNAWNIIDDLKDENGKVILKGTLSKSYLPKETVGKGSKWATFYTLLAEKQRNCCSI